MTAAAVQEGRVVLDARAAVAAEVRSLMGRHCVNQKRLAQALGSSQAAVSRRLSGDIAFDVDELTRIARLFDTTVSDLVASASSTCFWLIADDGQMELSYGPAAALVAV